MDAVRVSMTTDPVNKTPPLKVLPPSKIPPRIAGLVRARLADVPWFNFAYSIVVSRR